MDEIWGVGLGFWGWGVGLSIGSDWPELNSLGPKEKQVYFNSGLGRIGT